MIATKVVEEIREIRDEVEALIGAGKADFNRFVRNIPVLSAIIVFKRRSVYELAKLTGADVSNLNKVIQFFEEVGVVRVKTTRISGRMVRQPQVEYGEVTFRLAA